MDATSDTGASASGTWQAGEGTGSTAADRAESRAADRVRERDWCGTWGMYGPNLW